MHAPRLVPPLALVALATLTACPTTPPYIECVDETSCGLAVGGECRVNPGTGHQFCTYPDTTCPDGMRWSDLDVEDSISGTCVVDDQDWDAGIDAPPIDGGPDAPPDAGGVSQWAHGFGGAGLDTLRDLAVGGDQGVIVVGSFEQSISFGAGSLTSAGARDVFVAKLSASGDPVWSKRFGGTGQDVAYAVALDAAGDAYVIGTFVGIADFDGQQLGTASAVGEFAVKLNGATGARVWAVQLGSALADKQDVAVTAAGDAIAVTGAFYGTINLGGAGLISAGGADVALAKYTGAGAHVWSRRMGGTSTDMGYSTAFVGTGDVAVVGSYKGPAAFGAAQPMATIGTGVLGDVFVARYASANGAHVWSFGYGGSGPSEEELFTVATDASAVYVGGHFGGSATFGGSALVANGSDDGVLAKYDAATGSHIWSKRFGGTSYETVQRVILDGAEVWFGGYFSGTTTIGTATLTTAGVSDLFYAHAATATGDVVTAGSAGGPAAEKLDGFGLSPTHVWIGASFTAGFPVFGSNLAPAGMSDVFVGRTER